MSFDDKNFCFNCKLDAESLEKKKKILTTCSVCKIAQYCGQDCQRQDYLKGHKMLCVVVYKRSRDLAAKAKKILDDNGHDVTMKSLKEFYAKNGTILQCHKKVDYAYLYAHTLNNLIPASDAEKHPLERGETIDMGQVFWTYVNCKNGSVKILMEIAKRYESHRGIQIALDAYLETIMALQPDRMYLRALVPLLMLQLGKDDDAYNFIKFWVKNTPKDIYYQIGEDGLFPQLPFTEFTMKDQDKTEDLFKVLDKEAEKPYFIYFPFYVCLAIIKRNNYHATKDKNQERQFIICLKYIKSHYKHLLKDGLLSLGLPYEFRGNPKITKDHGLLKGCYVNQDVEGFAADFISNFMADLETYLDRAPQLKKEMLKHL